MDLRAQRKALLDEARAIGERAKAAGRQLNDAEIARVEQIRPAVDDLTRRIAAADRAGKALDAMSDTGQDADADDVTDAAAGPSWRKSKRGGDTRDPLTKAALAGFRQHMAGQPLGEKAIAPAGTLTLPVDIGAVAQARPEFSVVPLLSSAELEGTNRFTFMRQGPRASAARAVAVGAVKPTTTISLGRIDGEAATVAHLSEPIARQDLADFGALEQFIGDELSYGVQRAVERIVVAGTGTAPEPAGVLTTSGVLHQDYTGDVLTTARSALTRLAVAGESATAWAMHPTDWQAVETARDANERFQLPGAPAQAPVRALWGTPAVLTLDVPPGTAVVGDWRTVILFVREAVRIDWTEAGPDLFDRNQVRFRAEARVGVALARPSALCTVDLTP